MTDILPQIELLLDQTGILSAKKRTLIAQHFLAHPIVQTEQTDQSPPLVAQSELCPWEFILLKGTARSYVLDAEGREVTLGLYRAPTIVTPNIARTDNHHSLVELVGLGQTKWAKMLAAELMRLMVADPQIREWGNLIMQKELQQKVAREWSLAALNGRERLLWFRENYPDFEASFPHIHIASFLGMTPVTLSRVRATLA